jgi:hypothetical protein
LAPALFGASLDNEELQGTNWVRQPVTAKGTARAGAAPFFFYQIRVEAMLAAF